MNKHYQAFKNKVSWFNSKNEPIDIHEVEDFKLTNGFEELFPLTAELINLSNKTGIEFKGKSMILFSWDIGSEVCGWLCQYDAPTIELIPEHQILIDNIGGIIASFNGPESTEFDGINYNRALTLNQDFMFVGSKNVDELDWARYYNDRCKKMNVAPIDLSNKVFFTREGNGSNYFYDRNTKEVLLFSPDHAFKFVEGLPNQPEKTMHTVKGVHMFDDFVELLTTQWLSHLH